MARRKIDQIVKAAVLEELREGTPAKELSVKYGIAESTVSRWRHAEGIDEVPYANAVIRSKPLKNASPQEEASAEASEASSERRRMIRHMVSLVNDLAMGGGLKSHDIKNLSHAAKVLSEADQREQQLLEEEQARAAKERDSKRTEEKLVDVGLGELKLPQSWVDQVDERLAKERAAMERGEAWAFPSYGITEHHPDWMREAYNRMLAKKRAKESNGA